MTTTTTFPTLTELGRPETLSDIVNNSINGLIIVSGSTGSGKTTTLASIGNQLQRDGFDVVAVRIDHNEVIPGIEEISDSTVSQRINRVLLSYLPDVVIMDDLRSPEQAWLVCELLSINIMVVVAVHAGNAKDAVERFVDLAKEGGQETNEIAAKHLLASVHQSLSSSVAGEDDDSLAVSAALIKAEDQTSMANRERYPFAYRSDRALEIEILVPGDDIRAKILAYTGNEDMF